MSLLTHQASIFTLSAVQSPHATTDTHKASHPVNFLSPCKIARYSHGPKSSRTPKQSQIICMAHPRRVQMVAKQIRREIADMISRDSVLQRAIHPEAALGADMYMTSVTTISDVEVSRDLQVAKVYVSVYGDDRGQEIAIEGLKAKTKYVRSQLAKRMRLRLTPEVRFIKDDSLERGSRVIAILEGLKQEREMKEKRKKSTDSDLEEDIHLTQVTSNHEEETEEEDWKNGEEDEDLIYIK